MKRPIWGYVFVAMVAGAVGWVARDARNNDRAGRTPDEISVDVAGPEGRSTAIFRVAPPVTTGREVDAPLASDECRVTFWYTSLDGANMESFKYRGRLATHAHLTK